MMKKGSISETVCIWLLNMTLPIFGILLSFDSFCSEDLWFRGARFTGEGAMYVSMGGIVLFFCIIIGSTWDIIKMIPKNNNNRQVFGTLIIFLFLLYSACICRVMYYYSMMYHEVLTGKMFVQKSVAILIVMVFIITSMVGVFVFSIKHYKKK